MELYEEMKKRRPCRYRLSGARRGVPYYLDSDDFEMLRSEAHRRLMNGFTAEIADYERNTVTKFELTEEQYEQAKKQAKKRK